MDISITLGVSESTGHKTVSLEDLGLTEQQWNDLDDEAKRDHLQEWVDELPEHPYWMVDNFNLKS